MAMDNATIAVTLTIIQDSLNKAAKQIADSVGKATTAGIEDSLDDIEKKEKKIIDDFKKDLKDHKLFEDTFKNLKQYFKDYIKYAALDFGKAIVNAFKNAWEEMSNMLQYSKLSDANTRNLAFTYGFSGSQAYGWDKAMKQLGFSDEEDLMYANAQELQQFRAAFEKYSSYYDDLAESGYFEQLQEYNVEMEDFKMEMQQSIIAFFIENKDLIMSAMKGVLEIAQFLLKSTSWLFGGNSSDRVAGTTDIISQYNTTSTSSNASLSVTNNFNNVDSSTSSTLSREAEYEYRQVIKALGGNV